LQAFKAQWDRLAERLSELSPSSRLFIGSLMVIVVMGLFLVGQYAGGTEKAPLRVRPAALDATKVWLDGEGIRYATDDAGRILVDESDRQVIQVRLATESSVPPSDLDWDAMMKDEAKSSIWDSPEVQRQRERRFSMTLLKVMVTNLEFVNDAQIAIDEPDQIRGPGRGFFPATASITVSTLNGPLTAGQARTIRSLVASGVSGMEVSNVVVSDQVGTLFAGDDRGAGSAAQLDGVSRGVETHYEQQIREVLAIDGLRVAVSALAEPRSSFESGREHGDPVTASTRGASEMMKQRGASGGGRPGYGSNVGAQANQPLGVSSMQNFSEVEAEDFNNDVIVDAVDIAIENPGGYVYKLSAVLNVPYLYLKERYAAETAADIEPTPAQLDELKTIVNLEFDDAISMMLQTPPPASNLKGDVVPGDVTVLFGHGVFPIAHGIDGSGLTAGIGGVALAASDQPIGVRTWLLGGLAVLGIGAMFMMARRASRPDPLPTAEELLGQVPTLDAAGDVVLGEASEVDTPLEAREVDETELRRKQMLGQLNEMVVREPSEAAVLVKQWIRQAS
jgi:flagellar biosynthesis/type III secretory pathway M-ring protein FliF/YscJ